MMWLVRHQAPLASSKFYDSQHRLHIKMFQNILCRVQAPVFSISRLPNRRSFSYVSAHSSFPASLYRFQVHRDSRLYDKAFEQYGREAEDGVEVNADGLVYPSRTVKCMRNATSHYSPTNLFRFEWCIIHAKYALNAKGHTDVEWLLLGRGRKWQGRRGSSLFVHPQRWLNDLVQRRQTNFSL